MCYTKFLSDLLYTGQVRIVSHLAPTSGERSQASDLLVDFERTWRLGQPDTPPPFSVVAGSWAAEAFFRAAQLLMFRDLPAAEVNRSLTNIPAPDDQLPENHYSVDLVFRFLPDLANFSQAIACDDPLTVQLRQWCYQWPLSSVGFKPWKDSTLEIDESQNQQARDSQNFMLQDATARLNVDAFVKNLCLRTVYIDRILERKDHTRFGHPSVVDQVKQVAGAYPNLAWQPLDMDVQK